MALGRISLAEQIAQLEEAAPGDYDPEDLQSRDAEMDDGMVTKESGVREHYVDVGPSSLRNRLPSVAHPKYEGVQVSRKQLLEESDNELEHDASHSEGEESEEEEAFLKDNSQDEESLDEEEQDDAEERFAGPSQSEESEGSVEGEAIPEALNRPLGAGDDSHPNDLTSTLKKNRENDLLKGQAVKRQIALWDTLLDARIRLQKSVLSANRLPPPSEMKHYIEESTCRASITNFLKEATSLADELLELQENLLTTNDIITPPPRKRRRLEDETPVEEYPIGLCATAEDAAGLEQAFHPYLLQTLSKWSSKIQAVAPSVLLPSNRGTFLKGGQNIKSVVQLIDENLADHDKLLSRTQIPRVKKPRIGVEQSENDKAEEDAPDCEIFDDTDFYQKLLRDIIESRGEGSKNEDWMVIQKQKKAKKKVDTKASKGRKLRYDVHEKLQNFMVPVPVSTAGIWHEEQIDELFASLLGKGFEKVGIEELQAQENVELTGFRVFG